MTRRLDEYLDEARLGDVRERIAAEAGAYFVLAHTPSGAPPP